MSLLEAVPPDLTMDEIVQQLHPREQRVLRRIAVRLLTGQALFGPLSYGKKDWTKEAKEEAMDMAVYLSALLEDDSEVES